MICRLCLKVLNEQIAIGLFCKSDKNEESKIIKAINKYMELQLSTDDEISTEICKECFLRIDEFRVFCEFIAKQQSSLLHEFLAIDSHDCYKIDNANPIIGHNNEESPLLGGEAMLIECNNRLNESAEEFAYANEIKDIKVEAVETDNVIKSTYSMKLRNKQKSPIKKKSSKTKRKPKSKSLTNKSVKHETNIDYTEKNGNATDNSIDIETPSSPTTKTTTTPNAISKLYKSEESKRSDELITSYMRLKCEICEVPVSTFRNLRSHFLSVHNCKAYIHCCGKRFSKRIVLVDHINFHLNPQHFQCKLCLKCLKSRGCLDVHMETTHPKSENLKFDCKECGKKFTRQSSLKYHSLKHKTERNFACTLCEKAFVTQNRLKAHIQAIHENISPYVCDFCGRKFKFKPSFDKHVLEHQGIYDQPIQCPQCNQWFKHKTGLRQHIKRHSAQKEVTCKVCSRVCPSKSSLQSHMRYEHNRQQNLQCSICERKFKMKKNLEEHIAMHTGEKHNPCPHCPREFRSKANMYVHIKRVHNEEWMKKQMARGIPQVSQAQ